MIFSSPPVFLVENLKRALFNNNNNMMNESNNFNFKSCTDCKTTKTPLWRGGPAGPKSLCNACGIRFRKKKRVIESLNRRPEKRKDKTTHNSANTNSTTTATASASAKSAFAKVDNDDESGDDSNACVVNNNKILNESFKMRLMMLQRSLSSPSLSPSPFVVVKKKQRCQRRRKLKEDEQAAFSLMALSCGFVFA